jgi:hypothetical protein
MEKPNLKGWAASSADPSQLSTTIRGGIIAASSVLIFLAASIFGLSVTPENITELATNVGMIVGGVIGVYGLIQKLVIKVGSN